MHMMNQRVMSEVISERNRQDQRWGVQNHSDYKWLAILTEEVGEVARDALEGRPVYDELIQVAAVAIAWAEATLRLPHEG
jgi:NTP pyrophosphatase (non-canonical NTP hydrolase)